MRVRLTATYATPNAAGTPGDILDLPRSVAKDLVDKGYAVRPDDERQTATPVQASESEVPSGKVSKVLEWVGDDPARAQAAIDREQARARPRVSLIEAAEAVLAAGEASE